MKSDAFFNLPKSRMLELMLIIVNGQKQIKKNEPFDASKFTIIVGKE